MNRLSIRWLIPLFLVIATAGCRSADKVSNPVATPVGMVSPTPTIVPTPTPTPTPVPTPTPSANLAPDFSLPNLLGTPQTVTLSGYRGQVVIVNFFASWCPPCREEMPALEKLYQTYRDQGLVVIGVGVQDGKRQIASFAEALGVTFPIVWDGSGDVSMAYRISGLPTTYFIDRTGAIRERVFGSLTLAQFEEETSRLLRTESIR